MVRPLTSRTHPLHHFRSASLVPAFTYCNLLWNDHPPAESVALLVTLLRGAGADYYTSLQYAVSATQI